MRIVFAARYGVYPLGCPVRGHSRPRRASRKSSYVCYAPQAEVIFRAIADPRRAARPVRAFSPSAWWALRAFARLRRRVAKVPQGPAGFRAEFLGYVDAAVRGVAVGRIFGEHFEAQDLAEYADVVHRTDRLAAWICEPLKGAADEAERGAGEPAATAG